MKEKNRFQGSADAIPPRVKLEPREPRAPTGKLAALSKTSPRRPAEWRVPLKKRLETQLFAQFANLAARLRRRAPKRPRDRFDAAAFETPRFRAPDASSRPSRPAYAARNLDAPRPALSTRRFPLANARLRRFSDNASTAPRAFPDALRDAKRSQSAALFLSPGAALSTSARFMTPTFQLAPFPALFSTPRLRSTRANLCFPESIGADALPVAPRAPAAHDGAARNPRLESPPFPRATLRAAPEVDAASRPDGGEDAAPGVDATPSFAVTRSSSSFPSSFDVIPTLSRAAAAFEEDALLVAPQEAFALSRRGSEARFETAGGTRDGGGERRGDTIDAPSSSVARTRRAATRERGDSVPKKDALFFVHAANGGASTQPDEVRKRGVSVSTSRNRSTVRRRRSVARWRFQTQSAASDATAFAPTFPTRFETRRFALDRSDRGVSTLGADALEGSERFREALWDSSVGDDRGRVETAPGRSTLGNATLGSSAGRRGAQAPWPKMETSRESANLATIERLLKESRDALVNLARDSKGEWILDVE